MPIPDQRSGAQVRNPVYLDHNATTPIRPEALNVTVSVLAECGNPSSVHAWGRAQRARIEWARETLAAWVGAPAEWITFTSGGTEANNLAVRSVPGACVLASAVEHDSVLAAASGHVSIPVDAEGRVRLDALDRLLGEVGTGGATPIVSVMLANNETGVIQPFADVVHLARARGALVHCDAVQGAGKIDLAAVVRAADLVTLSAHKMGGPQGVGALIARPDLAVAPLVRGGGQERGRRAGTEAAALIAGFGAAVRCLAADADLAARLAVLRDRLERGVRERVPLARIYGQKVERVANTTCVGRPGIGSEVQVIALDLAGVEVSAGAACSSGKVRASHVLAAMGVAPDDAARAIRVSLGWTSTEADVDRFLEAWEQPTGAATDKARAMLVDRAAVPPGPP